MKTATHMISDGDLNKDRVTCLSVSVISDEFEQQKTGETAMKEIEEGPSNGKDPLEYAINSQQRLFTDKEASPKMITQVLGAIVVSLTHLGIGAMFGFPGVTLPQLTQPDSDDIYLSPSNAALFGSIVYVGAVCGGLMSGPLVARIGLRSSLLLALPVTLVFWLMLAFSSNALLVIVARVGLGLMTGTITTPSNAYVLEISHKDKRGILFAAIPVSRQIGFLFVYSLGMSPLSWRHIALVCGTITTAVPFIGLFFFPESPRWLATRGREEEAKKALIFFRGERYDYQSELNAIVKQVNTANKQKTSCNQCSQLFQKSSLLLFLKLAFLTLLVGFNGSFAITTFLVPIFQSSSSDIDAYTSAVLVGAVRVVGTLCYLMLVDLLGRKPVQVTSYILMSLSHAVLGGYFYVQNIDWVVNNLGWLPLTSVLAFTFFLGVGQPVLFMVHGELIPTEIRSLGLSLLSSILFLGAFIVTQLFPLMTDSIGEGWTFWTYSIACFFVAAFTYIAIPETRGLSLEEINKKLVERNVVSKQS